MAVLAVPWTGVAGRRESDSVKQSFWLLRIGFALAPILFGLDKFTNLMVDWPTYLAPWLDRLLPGSAQDFMFGVGAVEIAAGLLVAIRPRIGGLIVAAWLAGIIVNLLTFSAHYDVALRDFGLLLGALSLSRLAANYERARA